MDIIILAIIFGFLSGSLYEKYKYFSKTGKYLQNVHNVKLKNNEEKCDVCGQSNVPWSADDKLWHKIADSKKQILCPRCFVDIAKKKIDFKSVGIGFKANIFHR